MTSRPPVRQVLERTLATVEDVEFMLATGAGWDECCRRTGRKDETLERLLERQGRTDLVTRGRDRDRNRMGAP